MSDDKTLLLQFLHDIERGGIMLTRLTDTKDVYNGIVRYQASNGWQLAIFVDCGEWDYVDEIVTTQGEVYDFDRLYAMELIDYAPSESVAASQYGIE